MWHNQAHKPPLHLRLQRQSRRRRSPLWWGVMVTQNAAWEPLHSSACNISTNTEPELHSRHHFSFLFQTRTPFFHFFALSNGLMYCYLSEEGKSNKRSLCLLLSSFTQNLFVLLIKTVHKSSIVVMPEFRGTFFFYLGNIHDKVIQ